MVTYKFDKVQVGDKLRLSNYTTGSEETVQVVKVWAERYTFLVRTAEGKTYELGVCGVGGSGGFNYRDLEASYLWE